VGVESVLDPRRAIDFPSPTKWWGGVRGGGPLRRTRKIDGRVPRARQLRRDTTPAERKLWWRLRELSPKGCHFRRQATIGPYFADFACHTTRLVIEIDGGQHGRSSQIRRDLKRDAYLKRNRYRVLRFWNNDVRENIEGVLSVIYAAVENARMPPTPDPSPPQAGGGEKEYHLSARQFYA
jgi:very-short-patch-repair endonuclease